MAIIVSAPASIKIDGVSVGTTLGDIIITLNRDYEPVKRQDSPHPFKYVKKNISFDIDIPVSEHSAENISRMWDILEEGDSGEGGLNDWDYTSQVVHELDDLEIIAGGITYRWAKVISIGHAGINYSNTNVTVIHLTLRAILVDVGTTATLDENNLPGQFKYKIQPLKRYVTKETYGGIQRYYAGEIYDIFIQWTCENMTIVEKELLETLFSADGEVVFVGIHGETYTVTFDELNAPEENDGHWSASGTLRVVPAGDTGVE